MPSFGLISRILAFLFTALDFFCLLFLSRKKSKALRRRIKFAIKNIKTAYWNKEYKPNTHACLFLTKGYFYWIPAFAGMTVLWFTAHITLLRNIR